MREAQHQAEFEAEMEADRQLLEERHLAKDAVEHELLMEQLELPAAEKPEPRRRGKGKKNAEKRTAAYIRRKCDHGRRKDRCKDCGTGYCKHNRRHDSCRDCGTGYCKHGHQKAKCKDCTANRQQTY
jgi:hypothetical protein